jgi:pyruvate formate lyase activating enzyme
MSLIYRSHFRRAPQRVPLYPDFMPWVSSQTLQQRLDALSVEAALSLPLEEERVRCTACGHRCVIPAGRSGVCKVRFNQDGHLRVPWGYVAGLNSDPIEKKPFFHAFPGALALSFGMLGCDYHCAFCQNWLSSQVLRDPAAAAGIREITAEEIVQLARATGSEVVVSTYNEPLITTEWAVEVFRLARREGLFTGYVSNGNGTPEVLAYLDPWIDLFKVDLKAFREATYRELGGRLGPVLETIRSLVEMGKWVEIVTLIVPGLNDGGDELKEMAEFIGGLSPDIPWHLTAYHPDYRMHSPGPTQPAVLKRAVGIGREAGLRFVYAGNLPGRLPGAEDTLCPHCSELLVERRGFQVLLCRLEGDRCPHCGSVIPGRWRAH